ncbi:LysR substrate-binding domain-containing protein [Sphingomonas prati]|uniref:LysR family glycine cleavage system transcriptional activator n=1 Tax=Sphingomonas prati TaxID=1843237 RepID=A0A7W9BU97_9SPHN|nr:LysR substrate-binding domain-containing protein [Sphingomonas prati]MBB5730242.1 LysR family glycine cleavage system transcriptional activator [Sphingomonas prati]GGE92632.1 LysR family transcriptional regulator [Sphingomonas prati]
MRRLPPLTAVEAFVQVARLGSVKAAAQELALSSPALSRRVQALERFVGQSLFDRRHQAMLPNAAGERLLARIAPAIDALAEAIDSTTGQQDALKLRLGVLPLFASQKLMARLPELRAAHPEFHVDIDTAPHPTARLGESLDAAIVLGAEPDPALYGRRIDRNRVSAIALRSLTQGPDAVTGPDDLKRMTIFVHRDMPETFAIWRAGIGRPDLKPAAIDHFDSGHLMLDAAAQGLGVAFMLDAHLDGAHDDRLTNLFGREVESDYSYWFVCRRSAMSNRAVRVFHDWLFSSVATAGDEPVRVAKAG